MRVPSSFSLVFGVLLLVAAKVRCEQSQAPLSNELDDTPQVVSENADVEVQGEKTAPLETMVNGGSASSVVHAVRVHRKRSVNEGRLYRVVNAAEGGWKASDVGAPFKIGSIVYCHKDTSNCSSDDGLGEGVDFLSNERTLECKVEAEETDLVRVKCEKEDNTRLLSPECCETATPADTSVYATPDNLVHYATWGNTEPITIATGMKLVEETYGAQLRTRYEAVPVIFLYFADWEFDKTADTWAIDNVVPRRVAKSSVYHAPFHRTLSRAQTEILSNRRKLALRIKQLGMNSKGGPFLATYFTLEQALTAVKEPTAEFFVKYIADGYAGGIHAQSHEELSALWEKHRTSDVVIQEVLTDLAQLSGHQFDIKFYVLVHSGRVYMHQNAEVVLQPRRIFNGTTTQQGKPSPLGDNECVHSFLSNKSTGMERGWLEAIRAQLVAALPVMEPVVRATSADDGRLYQIFAGKAMIRESNGDAVIVSFSDWPVVDFPDTGYDSPVCDDSTSELSIEQRKAAYEQTIGEMLGDFFSIALGVANTTAIADDEESCFLIGGRVREAIAFRSPNKIAR